MTDQSHSQTQTSTSTITGDVRRANKTQPTILVTGATGNTGGAVVSELLHRGVLVRAMVRSRDARSAALQARGAEVVVADIFDPDQLVAAMRGVQRAYYVPPYHPYVIQSAVAFAIAAREAKLEAIVQMSQWTSHRNHPALMTRQTWLMDRMFAEYRGIAHTILNPGLFADDFLRTIDSAALLGFFPLLSGNGRVAPVANEDIARTAVAVLMAPERHDGTTYRPTGPQLLSGREMAHIVATAVGHPVRPVHVPFWLFNKTARWRQGVEPFLISARQRGPGVPRVPQGRQRLRQRHGLGSGRAPIGRPDQKLAVEVGCDVQCGDQLAPDVFESVVV